VDERKTYYELVPSGVMDCGRTVRYGCPLGERCCSWVHDARRTESLGAEESTLVLVNGVNTEPWKDGVAQHVLGHLAELHGTVHWLLALGDQEDAYEKAAAGQNRENERAWHAARSAQESLQEARSELADTRLGLSEFQGLMSRVEAVLRSTIASAPSYAQERWLSIEVLRVLGIDPDKPPQEPLPDPQPVSQEFSEFLENARAKEDSEPRDGEALRGLLEHVGIDTEGLSISVDPQGEQ
jgi:hypothetical protein